MDRFNKCDYRNINNLKEASKNVNTTKTTENWIRVYKEWAN